MKILKRNIKRIVSLFLLIITMFSTIFSNLQLVFAATDTGRYVARMYETAYEDNIGSKIFKIRVEGDDIPALTETGFGQVAFCLNHHKDQPETYTTFNRTKDFTTDPDFINSARLAYLGYYRYSNSAGNASQSKTGRADDVQYAFTAMLIWQKLGQVPNSYSLGSDFDSFKTGVMDEFNKWETLPSFNGSTQVLDVGQTKTITDTKGVLQYYETFNYTKDGVTFSHTKGSNDMKVTVGNNVTKESVLLSQADAKNHNMGKYINNLSVQTNFVLSPLSDDMQHQRFVVGYGYNDPRYLSLDISINLFGKLELKKLGSDGELLDGAVFQVTGPDNYNQTVTVSEGKIVLENLKPGTYSITEKTAPKGYILDTKTYQVEVRANEIATQTISNTEPTGTFTLVKYNSDKSAKIKGVKYRIWNDNGYDEIYTTDDNGKIEVTGLKLGKYNYQETETAVGYLIDNKKYSFSLDYADQNTSVVFANAEHTNDEPTGEITIEKTDKETGNKNRIDKTSHHGDATLNGAVYTLYAEEDIYNVARTIRYFSKDEEIATFTFNQYGVASIKITNSTTPAKLSVNANTLCGMPMGKFYSRETRVPVGYNQDTNKYEYILEYENSTTPVIKTSGTVENTVVKAPFEIIKVSTNTNSTAEVIPNAEFTMILSKYVKFYGSFEEALKHLEEYAEDEYDILTTDSRGHAISKRLAYGEYTGRETYTPSPEINAVEDFYITIDSESNTPIKELVENDSPFEAYLLLQKKDKKSGKFVTYSNATFSLSKLNEDNGQWERVQCKVKNEYFDTWTTDSNGMARTETKMEAGTYKLDELKIPDGFLQLDEELIFKVNNRNSTLNYDQDWDAWITVTAVNEQPKGKLEVNKTINLRSDADKTLIKDIDYTKIAFELVANERIIDYTDGSTIYEEGQTVGTYNLNEKGKLVIDNLWMGSYYLKEVSTIDGAVLDDTKHDVVFTQTDTSTKKFTVKLDIGNDTTFVEFSKTDITGEAELKGAKLSVFDTEGNVIDSWTSSEKSHKIEGLKVGNTYILREEIAPDGFVKSTDVEFTVENIAETQKVQMIDKIVEMYKKNFIGEELEGAKIQVFDTDNNLIDEWISEKTAHRIKGLEEGKTYRLHEEISIEGYVKATDIEFTVSFDKETQVVEMIDKIVTMAKTDIGGNEVEGAKMNVTDENGEIVDSWTSTKESHNISGLEEGKTYTLHEETAPDGFVKATDVEFTVSTDKETQELVLIDKVLDVTKTDMVNGEEIEGAELVITDKDGNVIDSWTSTKEPHHVSGLTEGETYILTEKTSPYGYEIAESIEFTVSTDKETQLVEMKDMPIFKNVKVIKIDAATKETIKDKFIFAIYENPECTKLIKEVNSNKEDGTALFEELRFGTYYIKEIKAPKDYELSNRVVKIEINDKGIFVDDTQVEEKDAAIEFTFENNKIEVPKTGDESNIKLFAGAILLSLLGISYIIIRNHKKNKQD